MTALFGRDWWPAEIRAPRLRLAAGLVATPLILAALAAGLAFLIAGSALPDAASVRAATQAAALTALSAFPAFSFSFGLAAALLLWARRRRGAADFALAGAAAGALFALFTAAAFGAALTPVSVGALTAMGVLHMLILRRIAGLRAPRRGARPEAEAREDAEGPGAG